MFDGKVVLITGASSGIGADAAVQFSNLGASVVIVGRNQENLNMTSQKCEHISPRKLKALVVIADINEDAEIERIVKETINKYGKLDILVNNAGILESGSIETTSIAQYDRIMNTNMRAVYYLTMLAVPHLIKSVGNIVNISSVAGLRSFPNILAYCVSKAALDQFTKCVALELASKGVRVNAVNAGVTLTGIHLKGSMTEEQYKEYLKKCESTIALGRPASVEEVTAVITFLASDAASNITGVTLPVDGGRHAMCPR